MKTRKQLIDFEHKGNEKHHFKLRPVLLSLCMLTFIGGYSQTGQVNLNLKNATVKELFREIEKQTSYRFSYRDIEINNKGGITISGQGKELKEVLTNELAKQELTYVVSGNKIIVSASEKKTVNTKEKEVIGKVVDTKGEPVIGATIIEKGTTNGTITDFDGRFTLNVSEDSMIEVSYIGYQTQSIKTIFGKNIAITLKEDTELLDEVVVVGYGTQNKKTLTGAVSMVNMDDVEISSVTTVSHALAGKAAGFRVNQLSAQPGGGAKFRIRGEASVGAGNEPLFVIDGFPVSPTGNIGTGNDFYTSGSTDNILESLNPEDIESISVLKDAASTSIYGARAGHGVILITTKRGVKQKPKITYSGIGSIQIARSNYKMLNTRMYMDMYNKVQYEEWLKRNGMGIYEGYVTKSDNITPFVPEYSNDQIKYADETDWLSAVMQKGYMHQHNLSINGGSEKTRYLASINYMNQEGIIKNNGTSRFSARLNLDQEFNKYISMGITASYSQNKYDNVPLGDKLNEYSGVLTAAVQYNPTIPIYNSKGEYSIDPRRPFVPNPVSLLDIQDNTKKDRLIGNAFVKINPIKELEFKIQLGADRSTQKHSAYWPKTTLQGQIRNGRADISQENATTYLMEITSQYSKNWKDHSLKAIAGYSFQRFEIDGFNAGNEDFIIDGFGYNNLGAGNSKKPTVGSWASISSIASLFTRVNYSFMNKYLFEATLRADAASNFAPENRWGYFPSVSIGWLINEERFLKNIQWLSLLKLRASYGQTGNSNVGYHIYDFYSPGYNAVIGGSESTGVYASEIGNKELTWETTSELNIGLDFGILNNRINFTTEYFKRRISDLLVTNKPLPFYNEINWIASNIGTTQSQGVEFTFNSQNIIRKNFNWNTTLTLSHYNDRWLKRDPNWRPKVYEKEDDPLRAWWDYEAIGILQPGEKVPNAQKNLVPGMMKLKDQNDDGVLNDEDKIYIDNGDPKIIYGLNNQFKYKNFDFNIYFYGEAGAKRGTSYYESWTYMDSGTNVTTHTLKSFNSNNLTSKYPTYILGGNTSLGDFYVKPIYYIRCGNITLGYKVPISKKIADHLRIYVDINNPFIITNWSGLDPETDNGSFPYPNITSYNIGLSITL